MFFNSPAINFLKKHKAFLLVLIVFVTYSPAVFNKFIGDDHLLVEKNVFYSSWKNVPRLFERGYIHQLRDFFSNNHDYGSDCVSYRPVLSLTYFLYHSIWGNNPYGYHLTNILIHCLNCVLLYLILSFILGSTWESFLAALLFGLHPVQSEAVAVVGYRADILASFFILGSFYCWIKFQSGNYLKIKYYRASLMMYFLALFSKESAVLLPLVIFFYDQILSPSGRSLKHRRSYYAGFIPILIFYLYLYIVVFPNSALYFNLFGGSVVKHVVTIGYIWYSYLINFLAPWTIKLLPGEYCPATPAIFSFETLKMGVVFILFAGVLFRLWKSHRPGAFFLLWFLIFYFPVSNLIPLANPMAYRFMYLPAAGILTFYAVVLYKALNSDFLKQYSRHFFSMFYTGVVLICIICTVFVNDRFKDDFSVGYTMVEHFPTAPTGYMLLGQEYYVRGFFGKAKEYFEEAVRYGNGNPQVDMQLGVCYFHLGQLKNAQQYLLSAISVNPDFLEPYLTLGNIYYIQKEYEKECQVLEKELTLAPDDPSIYTHLMDAYINLKELKKAESLLYSADNHLSPEKIAELKSIFYSRN